MSAGIVLITSAPTPVKAITANSIYCIRRRLTLPEELE